MSGKDDRTTDQNIPENGAATETAQTATVDAGEYKVYGRASGPDGVVDPISIDPGAM